MKKLIWLTKNYNVSIYPICLLGEAIRNNLKKIYGVEYDDFIMDFKNQVQRVAMTENLRNQLALKLLAKITHKKWIQNLFTNIFLNFSLLIKQTDKVFKLNLSKQTDKQLLSFYKRYNYLYKKAYIYGWLPNLLEGDDNLLTKQAEDILKRKLVKQLNNTNQFGWYYSLLASPVKTSIRNQEELDLLKILIKNKNRIKLLKNLKKHHQKYCWLFYDYNGPALTLNYFIYKAKKLINKKVDLNYELKNIINKNKKNKFLKQKFLKKLGFNKKEKYLFRLISELIYIKNFRKDLTFKSYFQHDKLLAEISKRLHITLEQFKYILPDELSDLNLEHNLSINKINERMRYSALFFKNNHILLYTGQAARKFVKKMIKIDKIPNIKELTGQIAYSGSAIGLVKIVNKVEDMIDFKSGQILVSEKTNPNLIPAMKKAKAIITNTGGVTSHAAIIARELKIPCIIGTRFATKIFKNNDRVKVDANLGIIKLI